MIIYLYIYNSNWYINERLKTTTPNPIRTSPYLYNLPSRLYTKNKRSIYNTPSIIHKKQKEGINNSKKTIHTSSYDEGGTRQRTGSPNIKKSINFAILINVKRI